MSRVLNRPMFKLGGSTGSGITSGLVSKRYKAMTGGRIGFTNGGLTDKVKEELAVLDKLAPSGQTDISDFLIGFGLNMAGGTPSGNIITTAARAAQDPYEQFIKGSRADAMTKRATVANLLGGIRSRESAEKIAALKASEGGKYMAAARDLIAGGIFPDTPDGLKAALKQVTGTDQKTNIDSEYANFYKDEGKIGYKKATFNITMRDELIENVGKANVGSSFSIETQDGFLPQNTDARKRLLRRKDVKGKYFFDPVDEKIKVVAEVANEKGETGLDFVEVDMETYQPIIPIVNTTKTESKTGVSAGDDRGWKDSKWRYLPKDQSKSFYDWKKEQQGRNTDFSETNIDF